MAALWQESPFEEEIAGGESDRGGGCDSGGCDSCCGDSCGGCGDCCEPCGCGCSCPLPGWQIFGDYLFLRPRNAEVVYAVPFNGPIDSPPAVPIQVGRTAVADYGYESGFRAGFTRAFDDCASLGVTYTYFESNTTDDISIDVPYVIRSMVSHPSTWTATSDGLDANAEAGIDFDLIDLDYRSVFLCGPHYSMNYLVGLRYGYLSQDFRSQFAINGRESVSTDIRFDGGGIRLGLEGERYFCCSRLMVYGRGTASFVVGEFNASYPQGQAFDASVVDTGWSAGRVVPIMDLEVGVGWTSRSGRLRLTTGYMISAWYNTVKTDDFIEGVRTNDFVGLGDKLTFDGLTSRIELRY
ncbi:MAG: hypothetical protein A2V70_12940 [Planctomycetes bacterium RBG_13_63_9]|nr:MAG: hypothetical protein A2V70_12940 [Planctomycetes bacterium RBG_13_63_9]